MQYQTEGTCTQARVKETTILINVLKGQENLWKTYLTPYVGTAVIYSP